MLSIFLKTFFICVSNYYTVIVLCRWNWQVLPRRIGGTFVGGILRPRPARPRVANKRQTGAVPLRWWRWRHGWHQSRIVKFVLMESSSSNWIWPDLTGLVLLVLKVEVQRQRHLLLSSSFILSSLDTCSYWECCPVFAVISPTSSWSTMSSRSINMTMMDCGTQVCPPSKHDQSITTSFFVC